jgi:hypothetical protein
MFLATLVNNPPPIVVLVAAETKSLFIEPLIATFVPATLTSLST